MNSTQSASIVFPFDIGRSYSFYVAKKTMIETEWKNVFARSKVARTWEVSQFPRFSTPLGLKASAILNTTNTPEIKTLSTYAWLEFDSAEVIIFPFGIGALLLRIRLKAPATVMRDKYWVDRIPFAKDIGKVLETVSTDLRTIFDAESTRGAIPFECSGSCLNELVDVRRSVNNEGKYSFPIFSRTKTKNSPGRLRATGLDLP